MFDLNWDIPSQIGPLGAPYFESHEDYYRASGQLLNLLWVFNAETQEQLQNLSRSVNLHQKTVMLHVRRGDKILEAPYIPMERYAAIANQHVSDFKQVYLLTDELGLLPEIERFFPGKLVMNAFSCLTGGYKHSDFRRLDKTDRRQHTLLLLADLDVCRNSICFIGSRHSNLSYMAMRLKSGQGVYYAD